MMVIGGGWWLAMDVVLYAAIKGAAQPRYADCLYFAAFGASMVILLAANR